MNILAAARELACRGGWADVNESPADSVIREVEEESGYALKPLRLLAVYEREKPGHVPPFPYHVYTPFFHCELAGGSPKRTVESSESAFFRKPISRSYP